MAERPIVAIAFSDARDYPGLRLRFYFTDDGLMAMMMVYGDYSTVHEGPWPVPWLWARAFAPEWAVFLPEPSDAS